MKRKWLCILAALLAAVLLPIETYAAFSPSLPEDPTYKLSKNGFDYWEETVHENGKQALFYGAYNATKPDAEYEWVIHSVRSGSETTLSTVMDIALDYEKQTGRKVMLASNGDFFYATGANVESYVADGVVISKGAFVTKHCIGFDNKGKVVIGRMTEVEKRLMVVLDGEKTFFEIEQENREPGENGIAVYTTPGTYTVRGAGKYIIGTDSSNLTQYPVFGTSRRMATGTVTNDDSFTLKSGQFAVVVRGEKAQFFFDHVLYGVEVNLVEVPAGEFAGCRYVVGGYDILVNDGKVNSSFHTDNFGNVAAPRTILGFKEDGTAFLCMLDGRQAGYSVGLTVEKEAELAAALGAKYALELDGGGSTTVIVRIDDTLTLRNKPSDGSMRKVSNAVLLVEKEKAQPDQPTETGTDRETETFPSPAESETGTTDGETTADTGETAETETETTPTDRMHNRILNFVVTGIVAAAIVAGVVLVIRGKRKDKQ